jgi:hypothetical protein
VVTLALDLFEQPRLPGGMKPSRLAVTVDGAPLPDGDARALWERFSAWMEEHKGDLGGFAKAEGFQSIRPDVEGGQPILRASREAAQEAYAPVRELGRGAGKGRGR